MIELSEGQFEEIFTIEENHITGNEAFGGMFDTSDEELEYIRQINGTTERVWTIVETEGCFSYLPGMHLVNRFGYIVTTEERDQDYEVIMPFEWHSYLRTDLYVENWEVDGIPYAIEFELEHFFKEILKNAFEYVKSNDHVNSVMVEAIGYLKFFNEYGDKEDTGEYEFFGNFLKCPEFKVFGDGTIEFISVNPHENSARIYTKRFDIKHMENGYTDLT